MKRVVLGEGYLWAMGLGPKYTEIALRDARLGGANKPLAWDQKWWDAETTPRVRLVVEVLEPKRVKRGGGR